MPDEVTQLGVGTETDVGVVVVLARSQIHHGGVRCAVGVQRHIRIIAVGFHQVVARGQAAEVVEATGVRHIGSQHDVAGIDNAAAIGILI